MVRTITNNKKITKNKFQLMQEANKKIAFVLALILSFAFGSLRAQTTYTWNSSTAVWTTATAWTPTRTTPATNDILQFNSGTTVTPTSVPTQTIGQLLISGTNTIVNLQAGGANTLTISGGTGTDLSVASSCQLNVNGANALSINVATGATGSITGNMTFTNAAHTLVAVDASGVTFNSPSTFSQGTGCSGNVFGSGTSNSIVFGTGSTFAQSAGSNPFQKTQPASIVVFQTGSLYKMLQNAALSLSGRTYANLEIAAAGTQNYTGGALLSIDNLTMTTGTANFNLTGGINIKGNISVASGQAIGFSPASANTLTFNGTSAQSISNSGTLTFAANTAVVIANSAGVTFNQAQTISGSMTVNSGALLATAATLTLSGTPSISGTFQINQGGWSTGGTWNYNGTGTLNFNNSSGSYGINGDVFWPSGSNAPFNVGFIGAGGGTINSGLGARTIGGTLTLNSTLSVNAASQLTLNGTCQINNGGAITTTAPIYGASSTLKYNSGTTYGRSLEWSATGAGTIGTTAGYPNHVQLSNNTTLNLGNGGTGTARACNGNLTVDDGSSLSMNVGGSVMTATLTVGGNVTLGSAGTANLTLSGSVGGDLIVKGNWTRNATSTLVNNGRQVTFQGGAAQTLTGNTTFDYFKLNNSAGLTLQASSPITINNQCDLTSGKLTLGANNVTMASAATFLNTSSSNYLVTNSTGVLIRNSASGSKDFPIGPSASFYTPLTINNTGTANNISAGVGTSITNAVTDNTKIVNLQWSVLSAGAGATANITYQWNTGNHAGSFAVGSACELGVYTTGPYTTFSAGTPTGSNPYTVTVNSLSLPTSGNNFYVIGNVGSIYSSPPTVTTPTVSAVTENSAVLGANVTSDGGFSITGRGTSYKTSSPVVATDNQAAEGTNTTGVFTMSRSGLSAQTQYFFVGYASNTNGTAISSESSFRTKSNPPTAPASSLSGTPISTSQIDLSWTGATFPGTGATQYGYLIVYSTGTPSLIGSPNGNAPGSVISVGTLLSSSATNNPTLPSTTASATGLTTGTSYNFLVVPYTWDGTNASTYNYYTTSPATASATTNAGSPVLSSPTVSSITESSAVLGATVTADGGSSLTARGTAYKTSSPVAATDNQAAEGGTSVAAFTHTRSGLSAETQYFYVGYATNASTTGISSEGSFRTLSNPPTAAASSLSGTPASQTQINLSWSAASYPGSGATQYGYLVVYSTSTPSLVGSPNGLAPASVVSVGTLVSTTATNNPTLPSTSASATGLTANTSYNFLVVPYTWDGTNSSTYNYYTSTPATASATTFPNAPTVTTTVAATSVTNTGASSGGQTLSGTVTSKGVVWNTTANPTLPGLGSTSDGSGTANFTSTITGLSGQTLYNVRAYASNTGGTGYGTNITLRTKSDPATAQASALSGSPISTSQIDLSWTGATYPGSGATQGGYLIVYSTGTPALVGSPNGLAPASAVSVGTIVSSTATNLPTAPAVTASANGLSAATTYNFLVVPYTWDGTNSSTYNYLTTSAPTASATTNDGSIANDFFRSIATGNWTSTSTWESSHNGSTGWISATLSPGASSKVTVRNTHNVTYDFAGTIVPTSVTVDAGGTLTLSNSGNLGSSASTSFTVNGTVTSPSSITSAANGLSASTFTINSGGVFQNSSGIATAILITTFTVNNGGTYNHDAVGSTTAGVSADFPGTTRTFGATSNVTVTLWGNGVAVPGGALPNNMGNLTINVPAFGGSWQMSNAITTIQGNLTIQATGGGAREFRIAAGTGQTLTVGGNISVTGGILNLSSGAGVVNVNLTGGFSVGASGTFSAGGTSGTLTFVNPGTGDLSVAGTATFGNITVAASRTVNVLSNITIPTGKTFTVNGTCNLAAAAVVSGAGTFRVSGGVSATLGIASTAGITVQGGAASGNVQTTTKDFQSDAFYTYNGSANQITGTGLPSQVRILTINNTGTSGNNIVTLTNGVSNQNGTLATFLNLTAGKLDLNGKTLSINNNNIVATGGDFTSTAGPVAFSGGTPSVTGTVNFPTVTMSAAVDFGTASTIVTSLTINGGNVAGSHPPFYGTGSTLIYNVSYGVFDEWKTGTSGAGVPYHVQVNSGTTLNLAANPASRQCNGNLIVNGTVALNAANQPLTVVGNCNITATTGTLSLGTSNQPVQVNGNVNLDGTLTLSTTSGGDIKLGGNWNFTVGGTLNGNGRAVFFNGSAVQTITRSAAGALNFDYILNQNTSGGIKQASGTNININGATNGLQLQGTGTGASWDLNGNTMTIATNTNIALTGSQAFASSNGSATLAISGGTSNVNSGTGLSFGSNVTVALNGGFNFGSSLSTFNSGSVMQINAGGFVNTNAPIYASGSTLRYNSATTYGRNLEWSTTSGAGYPYDVEVASGTTLDLSANGFADRAMAGSLNLIGSLTMGATTNKLTVGGNVTIGGTLTLSTQVGGDIYLGGNWLRTGSLSMNSRAVFFNGASGDQSITRSGGETIDYLFVDKASGKVVTASDLTIGQSLTISNGTFEVGSGTTLDMISNQVTGTGALIVTGTFKTSKAAGFSGTASTAVMNSISSITLGSASTVDYSSGGSQTITAGNYANLSNSGDGNRTLSSSGTIGISATLTPGAGNYTITGSTVEYNGTTAQTAAALLPDSKYNNLVINNAAGVGMNADLNLVDALTLSNGALVTTGYNFTLLSSATQTARIAPVTSGSVTGNIVMQRFAAGGNAGWATMGMPVSSATINEWNDDIIITGINGGASGTGSFVSIYKYVESATGNANDVASYVAVADVTDAVDPKQGYFVFLGDNATTVADKLIDVVGPPLIGTQNMNVTFTANTSSSEDGWNLVSNPYCSAIDWLSSNWTKTNIDDAIYIYDADNIQYTGSVGGISYNGGNEIIASSQAFMVHANAASPVLIASEGVKDAGSPTFYKSNSTASIPGVLRLQLNGLNGTYTDETVFRTVAGASANFDPSFDAYKLYSLDPSAPNISSKMNGIEYVVNAVDELTNNLDLPVRVNVNTPGSYTINFKGLSNFSNVSCFTFEDKLTNTSIDLKVDSSYTFSSGIDTVLAYNRFVLHFGVENIVPVVIPSATTVSIPGNATVSFDNLTTGASSYSWNFGDGSPVESIQNPSHTYTAAGTYTVTLTAANNAGCSQSVTVNITVDDVTGLSHINADEAISVTKDAQGLYVNYNFTKATEVRVNLYNSLGALIGETQVAKVQNAGKMKFQTNDLAKGVYTVEVLFDKSKFSRKVEF